MSDPISRSADLAGGALSYLDAEGGAETIVLLHGIGSGARSWRPQFQGLAPRHRLLAWNAPGYGESAALPMPQPSAGDYAAVLDGLLTQLGIARFHLVGHSLGALIAARFAADHPGRIASLTLASIAGGHARLAAAERDRLRAGRLDTLAALGPRGMAEKRGPNLLTPAASETMRRAVIDIMAAIRPDGFTQAVMMLSGGDVRADVARLAPGMPVQIVFGDGDTVTTPAANRAIASERPQAPIHVIPGAGHAVYLEQPDAFNATVAAFVAAASSSPAQDTP